ncbi:MULTISPECIES: hypothetical protein [unclassified Salinivibrio]|uniref:hypothetical protein n=1 Tax=unclassified Salinivibrio TaxID=2636825 RepID=UPI00128D8FCB|nr:MULTISPECIES: hypothetical protein [unclassified Salinivibrio]MPS31011.1 hypothetical protein [Salinivibrio sp. VYel7]MPX92412.1 hypothetical protein [Salinivibrio sp. VYel9]MPX97678.1 hypothetical protein [Salinivibrio sp. VYel6]MPX98644.1 hypothetical protein [Salinivibrio sp. VYel4]MPY01655.1 hypothetical protein [Salinivibrio sp. VYel5]
MATDTLIIISSLLESVGLVAFFLYVIKGLKSQISALSKTIDIQNRTLDAMESRVTEIKKLSETYNEFTKDLPSFVENYHKTVKMTKDLALNDLTIELQRTQKHLKVYRKIVDEVEKDIIVEKINNLKNRPRK